LGGFCQIVSFTLRLLAEGLSKRKIQKGWAIGSPFFYFSARFAVPHALPDKSQVLIPSIYFRLYFIFPVAASRFVTSNTE
jgi:hypothetical protein